MPKGLAASAGGQAPIVTDVARGPRAESSLLPLPAHL